VLNLEEGSVGVAVLGNYLGIREGDEVKAHRPTAQRALRAQDGRTPWSIRWAARSTARVSIDTPLRRPLEFKAPGIAPRQPVHRAACQTGLKAIDSHDPHRPGPARADHRRPSEPARPPWRSTPSSTSAIRA
jgi:F-type H+-transporting ATPase subunit alpha